MTTENKHGGGDERTICVVVPAYNAAHLLSRVLHPLMAMLEAGEVQEVQEAAAGVTGRHRATLLQPVTD